MAYLHICEGNINAEWYIHAAIPPACFSRQYQNIIHVLSLPACNPNLLLISRIWRLI